MYTVKQLSDLAGVSVRTLHHYDDIGLLRPSRVGGNGYRYYDDDAVLRLQQILFFRELDLSLGEIKAVIELPAFDLLSALQLHRAGLEAKIRRLRGLIHTIDRTMLHITGETTMSQKNLFHGFSEEEEKQYAQQARERYGAQEVDASYKLWNSYTAEKKEAINAESSAIYQELAALTEQDPTGPDVQAVIGRWHQHMRYFYEPSVARLRGLSHLYVDSPDFAEKFRAIHPDLPEFMQAAIGHYCDNLDKNA